MSVFTLRSLKIHQRFVSNDEGDSNRCIYKKINPIDIGGVLCNSARCLIGRSELVKIAPETSVMRIVE